GVIGDPLAVARAGGAGHEVPARELRGGVAGHVDAPEVRLPAAHGDEDDGVAVAAHGGEDVRVAVGESLRRLVVPGGDPEVAGVAGRRGVDDATVGQAGQSV